MPIPVNPRGGSEVAELGEAFSKMRGELLTSEQRRFATERIAAFGRAASSISHDLRHYLAAVVANAEFLYEAEKLKLNRDEIYCEIKTASEQMVDLLDSLKELSREGGSISPRPAAIDQTIQHAVDAVSARTEMSNSCNLDAYVWRNDGNVRSTKNRTGLFQPRLERLRGVGADTRRNRD
jgi:signal transduction histidine kinase